MHESIRVTWNDWFIRWRSGLEASLDWKDLEESIPAYLTMVLMPFTYSITNGIGAGFVLYVLIKLAKGKAKQVHPLMWVIGALFFIYFAQGIILHWMGR